MVCENNDNDRALIIAIQKAKGINDATSLILVQKISSGEGDQKRKYSLKLALDGEYDAALRAMEVK